MKAKITRWVVMLVLPIAAVVVLSSAGTTPNEGCPPVDPQDHTVMLPKKEDCAKYFECVGGVPVEKECPHGLWFDTRLNVCTFPFDPNAVFDCDGHLDSDEDEEDDDALSDRKEERKDFPCTAYYLDENNKLQSKTIYLPGVDCPDGGEKCMPNDPCLGAYIL